MSKLLWQGEVNALCNGVLYRICIDEHSCTHLEQQSVDCMGGKSWHEVDSSKVYADAIYKACIRDMARMSGKL